MVTAAVARREGERRGAGFTLVELMVVVAIIGLLAGIAVPIVIRTYRQAKENRLKHDLRVMRDLVQQYRVDRRKYPETLQALVDDGYLREIPKEPIHGGAEVCQGSCSTSCAWLEVLNEVEDPDDPNADTGVVEVKSCVPGNDLEGVPFGEY